MLAEGGPDCRRGLRVHVFGMTLTQRSQCGQGGQLEPVPKPAVTQRGGEEEGGGREEGGRGREEEGRGREEGERGREGGLQLSDMWGQGQIQPWLPHTGPHQLK